MRDLTPGLMTNSLGAVQAAFDSGSAGEKSTFQTAVSGNNIPLSQKGAPNGVATLGSDAKVPASQIPDIAIVSYLGSVADQAAMLSLVAQTGDWCSRADTGTVFVCIGTSTSLGGWQQLSYPASAVQSVCGLVGVITIAQLQAALTLGSAAYAAASAFASAAQGAKADAAMPNTISALSSLLGAGVVAIATSNMFIATEAGANRGVFYGNSGRFKVETYTNVSMSIAISGTERLFFDATSGNIGVGVSSPTARLHLRAGAAAAGNAAMKLTSGVLLTTPEAGAVEFDGTNMYFTNSAGVRKTITAV